MGRFSLALLVVFALACGGDGGGGPAAPPTPTALEKVGGDGQTGATGVALSQPFEVRVVASDGSGVSGHPVAFAASGGSLSPSGANTDQQGRARTLLTLPSQAGTVTVTATAQGLPPVTFTATAVPPPVQVTTQYFPAARVGLPYSRPVAASGGTGGGGYTFTVASGSLPPGLSIDGSNIAGSPSQAGAFTVQLRASDGVGGEATRSFTMNVCDAPTPMEVGEVRTVQVSNRGSCGLFLPSGAAGARYRVGVVRTDSHENGGDVQQVGFVLNGNGVQSGVVAAPPAAPLAAAAPVDVPALARVVRRLEAGRQAHLEQLEESAALVRRLGPTSVAPSSGPASPARAMALPDKMKIDASAPLTCSASTPSTATTAIRLAENDWLALYQDSTQNASASTRVTPEEAERLITLAATYAKEVLEDYFGAISDLDQNGKVIVFVTPALGNVGGRVWSGDFYPKSRCGASNFGEYVYLHVSMARDILTEDLHPGLQTLSHELKHVTSLYQRVVRAGSGSSAEGHPTWMEEGAAELAAEVVGRHAWSTLGGPAVNVTVSDEQLRAESNGLPTIARPETFSVLYALFSTQEGIARQPNSIVSRPPSAGSASVYNTGWLFMRWLGDAYGGAATAPRADAAFFRAMNASTSPSGIAGIEARTGRSWAQLMEEFASAAMANGRGLTVDRAFTSYDFVRAIEMWCFAVDPISLADSGCSGPAGAPGAFPWPVTTDSQGASQSRGFHDGVLSGTSGPSGLRVYDLLSNGTGSGAEINVEAQTPLRIRVIRLR